MVKEAIFELSICPELSVCPIKIMEVVPEQSIYPEMSVCPMSTVEVLPELYIYPELSVCPYTTMEVVPLSLVLPVLGVAIWCVWASNTIPDYSELPPSLLSHHLFISPHHHLRSLLSGPQLTLSLQSQMCVCRWSANLHRHCGWRIP